MCGTNIPAARLQSCTRLHEYLETKTTTHEFESLEGCLGGDESSWSAMFDGVHSNITLSGDAGETSVLTPLKVTHSANCKTTTPTLTVQMDTTIGSLTVGALSATTASVGSVSLARASTGYYTFHKGCNSAAYDVEGTDSSTYWCTVGQYCGCYSGAGNADSSVACAAKNGLTYTNAVKRLCFEEAMADCDGTEHCLGFAFKPGGSYCLCGMATNPTFYSPTSFADWGIYARAS